MFKISASEIDQWARSYPRFAQEILPELIIRLIVSTSKKIKNFNFPIEKGIQFSGYDGVLESIEQTNYFPKGKSVWEFGTNEKTIDKFRDDIKKRANNPLGVNIKKTIFIFATLKIWNHRTSIEELINESKALYTWKDIYIYDASKISLWLEQCSGVSLWMCQNIGKNINGMLSIEQYWDEYCNCTTPKLNKEFFLFSRDEQFKTLSEWLKLEKDHGYRVLESESSLESVLFVIATVISLAEAEDNILKALKSRIIIVTTSEAWNNIMVFSEDAKEIIFIPVFNFTEDLRCPKSISAILPICKYSPNAKIANNFNKIVLPIHNKETFIK